MARSTNLDKFRDFDPHEVVNLYTYNAGKADKGEIVKVTTSWKRGQDLEQHNLGKAFTNTVSPRWALKAEVGTADSGDNAVGMLLSDMREEDENARKLIDSRTKQYEKHVVLSGEAIPFIDRGLFRFSGSNLPAVSAGEAAYASGGQLTNDKVFGGQQQIGRFLSDKDGDGYALLKLNIQ